MKKLLKYLLSILLVTGINTGCDYVLDIEPRTQLEFDLAISTLDGLEGAILGAYERGRFIYSSNDICLYKLFYTDIIKASSNIADQQAWNQMARFLNFDATNSGVATIFYGYYRGLYIANSVIENIDKVEVNENNPSDVDRRDAVLGEAYFFRAYFHLSLVQYWDRIFLADRVLTSLAEPGAKLPISPKEVVYELIVSDLENAIGLLPEASSTISRGKVSKGVARLTLANAHMDLQNYAEAAILAEEVINDPAYSLLPVSQLEDIFSAANQDNSEIVFSWQFWDTAPAEPRQRTSQQLVPLYDRVNGVARSFNQGGRPWGRMVPSEYYWTLWDENDPRLNAWHKRYWIYDANTAENPLPDGVQIGDTVTVENMTDAAGLGALAIEPTTKKYWEDATLGRTIDDAEGFKNIIQYRVSEAYLIAAECQVHGHGGTGQARFDELRAARGVGSIPLNLNNVIDEQARELGFEGRRYPMLKRLGILVDRVKMGSPSIGNNMLPHHVRWPIPLEEVLLNGVQQNENY